ncbi:hypothetical protein AUJ14_04110 [Candidatus Micrarchaeota archaeon CG1_02_55_22]|nr:MAG: hypothetical protein AUJ14_04110 [Candidatus Micrarchaeota archaeon CG1_02_55_22]
MDKEKALDVAGKAIVILVILAITAFALKTFVLDASPQAGNTTAAPAPTMQPAPQAQSVLHADFNEGTSGKLLGIALQPAAMLVTSENAKEGKSVKLTATPGTAASNRAQLSTEWYPAPGQTVQYRLSFIIPTTYAHPDKWQTLASWSQVPDKTKNESWADVPSYGPPLSLRIGNTDGELNTYLNYGLQNDSFTRVIGKANVTRGEWNDLWIRVKWSLEGDGFVEATLNGQPLTSYSNDSFKAYGANLYNPSGNRFLIGINRDPTINTTMSIYYDDVDIATEN